MGLSSLAFLPFIPTKCRFCFLYFTDSLSPFCNYNHEHQNNRMFPCDIIIELKNLHTSLTMSILINVPFYRASDTENIKNDQEQDYQTTMNILL